MATAVFAYQNLADSGTVSVSSALSLTPPARLTSQFPQIVKKCRNNGENTWAVITDLLSAQSVDLFALFGLNLTSAATAQFRFSSADSSGLAGDLYDSGIVAGLVDAKYGYLIRRIDAPVSARYARIDVAEAGVAYIEAGRNLIALSHQVGINFAPGWGRNRVDRTKNTETEDGVEYSDRRSRYRLWDLSFDFLSEDEANGFVEEMNYLNGETDDVLLISDPDSANLGRDSIYGRITGGQPLIQPYPMSDINSRKFTIRERL
jgi:hypothetical protein